MEKILIAVLTICILIFTYNHILMWFSMKSVTTNGRKWNVIGTYDNNALAAQKLSRVNNTMIKFMRYLKEKYHIDEPDDIASAEGELHNAIIHSPNDKYNMVDNLLTHYNPDVFYENDPKYSKDTSYTLNKGSSMYICLRSRTHPNELVDDNTLLFVMLHECSHIANYRGWGHDTQFWTVFKWILSEAVLAGIYTPIDYDKHPTDYCGLNIYYQPLNDKTLRDL